MDLDNQIEWLESLGKACFVVAGALLALYLLCCL